MQSVIHDPKQSLRMLCVDIFTTNSVVMSFGLVVYLVSRASIWNVRLHDGGLPPRRFSRPEPLSYPRENLS